MSPKDFTLYGAGIHKRTRIRKAFCNHIILFFIHSFSAVPSFFAVAGVVGFIIAGVVVVAVVNSTLERSLLVAHFYFIIFVNTKTLCSSAGASVVIPRFTYPYTYARSRLCYPTTTHLFIYLCCFLHSFRQQIPHNLFYLCRLKQKSYIYGTTLNAAQTTHTHISISSHMHMEKYVPRNYCHLSCCFFRSIIWFCYARKKSTNGSFV